MKSAIIRTNGKGYWTKVAKLVTITDIDLDGYELRVSLLPGTWNVVDGLIYTDPQFIKDLAAHLVEMGLPRTAAEDVDYSEAGMQGHDYVSLDAGPKFVAAWKSLA
jgi:hypothetical protein